MCEQLPHRRLIGRVAILLMKSPLLLICICLNISDWGKRGDEWSRKGRGREPYFEIRRRKWVSNEMKRSEFLITCVASLQQKNPRHSFEYVKCSTVDIGYYYIKLFRRENPILCELNEIKSRYDVNLFSTKLFANRERYFRFLDTA